MKELRMSSCDKNVLKSCLFIIAIFALSLVPGAEGGLRDAVGRVYDMVADVSCSTIYSECCRSPYIRTHSAVQNLRRELKEHFFGQHIAVDTVVTALDAHLNDDRPSKPLVLSFHGWAGSGKTYLAELIIKALYEKGTESNYIRMYTASYHFPDKNKVSEYQNTLQKEIKATLKSCERSVFIFDEVDVTPPKLFDSLVAFLDRLNTVEDVNHKKAIYIFLSNVGSNEITYAALNAWREGKKREELGFNEFHDAVSKEAFNAQQSGMSKTRMIERVLVDFFIPFLPMERQHVIECAKEEIKRHRSSISPELIADKLTYWPPDLKLYSQTGCKRVESLVKFYVSEDRLRDEL